jgi:hypothetical protein
MVRSRVQELDETRVDDDEIKKHGLSMSGEDDAKVAPVSVEAVETRARPWPVYQRVPWTVGNSQMQVGVMEQE